MIELKKNKLVQLIPSNSPKNPLVSICIQTYNHENYIKECINGVLMQQTNFDFEILIGEDDSEDNTREICKRYAFKYPTKIRLFLHDRKNVIYIGKNPTGRFNMLYNLEQARGKYIALCEGDDYWTDPLKLQRQVDFLEVNDDYSICFHDVKILLENKRQIVKNTFTREVAKITGTDELSKGNYIHTASVVFKKNSDKLPEWFRNVPFGDYALHSINSLKGKIFRIDEEMAVYRVHDSSIMRKYKNQSNLEKLNFNLGMIKLYKFMFEETKIIVYNKYVYNLLQDNRKIHIKLKNYINARICTNEIQSLYRNQIKPKQSIVLMMTKLIPFTLYAYYRFIDD